MNSLMEKNKFNNEQIKEYNKKCLKYNPTVHLLPPQPSSDDSP